MLASAKRAQPVRRYNGLLLATDLRLAGGHRGTFGQPGRTVGGVPKEIQQIGAQVFNEQLGICRLLYGHLFVAAGLRGPGVQRKVLQLRLQLAKR